MRRNDLGAALRRITLVGIGLLAAGSLAVRGNPQPAPSRVGFETGQVWQVHLTIPAKEYEAMQPRGGWMGFGGAQKPKAAEAPGAPPRQVHKNTFGVDLPWAAATVTINGETFKNVGVRYKGNGTIADAARTIKKSIKIDLDFFDGKSQFKRMKTVNLHSGAADPSKCRETVSYGLYRAAGVPAPLTAFAEVRLTVPEKYDQELLGVYTVVEQVDRPFLQRHFGADDGLLLKPEGVRELEDRGEDWQRYVKQYLPKREATKQEIERVLAFVRLVHKADDQTFQREIESSLDVDGFLRFLAATSFAANTDSFWALGHNYYVYLHPKTGKFHFFPWDLDRALANLPFFGSTRQQMNLSFRQPYSGTHRLTDRIFAMPGMNEKYQALLQDLAKTAFARERLLQEVATLEAATRDLIARDAQAAAARKEPAAGIWPLSLFKPPALKTFMEKRSESLAAQLAGKSKGHVPTGGFGPGQFRFGDMVAGPMLEGLEIDQDGNLSKDEWLAAAKRLYDTAKKDEQGRVNEKAIVQALNEMLPKPPEGQPGAMPGFGPANFMAGPILKRADADKDGFASHDEMMAAATKLFDQYDKESQGKLDEDAFAELLNQLIAMPGFAQPAPQPNEPKREEKKP